MTDRSKRRFLVLQHIALEHPGIFREFLAEDGVTWDAIELDEGESIPDVIDYDALWVMGGPMDVWEEQAHPWLIEEQAVIRRAVLELNKPYFGLCLGHQLLASALGGKVGPAKQSEVGIMQVSLTDAGRQSPFLKGFDSTIDCLQWHGAEVLTLPKQATVLAESPACAVQAIQVGDVAFSTQFHVELTASTISDWSTVPAYHDALVKNLGEQAIEPFKAQSERLMGQFNKDSRLIYDNFMATAGF